MNRGRLVKHMRLALSIVGVLALACLAAALYYGHKTRLPALTITPTGQPRFQTSTVGIFGSMTTVWLPVAVTNNTGSTLIGNVGIAAGDNLSSGVRLLESSSRSAHARVRFAPSATTRATRDGSSEATT